MTGAVRVRAMRVGLLVNPDAGLGGRLGYKGSDGRAAEARAAGAEDRSGPRMRLALERLAALMEVQSRVPAPTLVPCGGRMGAVWLDGVAGRWDSSPGPAAPAETTADDTIAAVAGLVTAEVDLILYAGGDGTTRDIVGALATNDAPDLPIIGVPGGVKMHSGCFAATPAAAAEVVVAWLAGHLGLGTTEVMDLDEERYREGEWSVRLYAEVQTPSAPRWMQGAKELIQVDSEDDILEGLAEHLADLATERPERLMIWGSGGTLRRLMTVRGHDPTLLGIDATVGAQQVGKDLDEAGLLALLDEHGIDAEDAKATGEALLLLSPMGGQGFLIGRGNLQLSPRVLRRIGPQQVLAVATPAKLLGLAGIRIDTGDAELDAAYGLLKYQRVLQGYRTTRLVKLET